MTDRHKTMSFCHIVLHNTTTNYPEPTSFEELHQVALSCPERLKVRALIVRERFLGPYHTDNVFKLIVHGKVHMSQ
jgi:hypothetical protein